MRTQLPEASLPPTRGFAYAFADFLLYHFVVFYSFVLVYLARSLFQVPGGPGELFAGLDA